MEKRGKARENVPQRPRVERLQPGRETDLEEERGWLDLGKSIRDDATQVDRVERRMRHHADVSI